MLSEQQQRIMGYFIEEAKDHLNTIEQGLVNLQATITDSEMVHEVFRAAHSVKGGAAMLGLDSIQQTAHRLEDYFKVLKECPQVQVDQKLETLFLRAYDTLHELVDQLQGPFGLTHDKAQEVMANVEPVFAELNQHLNVLVHQAGGTPPEDVDLMPMTTAQPIQPMRTAAVVEESALRFIFQTDVPTRLRDMLQLFKQTDSIETRQQLQDLCRGLAQFGEQFQLSGWCTLLEVAQQAIGNPDNNYRTLAPILIKDIKRAQELILSNRAAEVAACDDLLCLLPPEDVGEDLEDLEDLEGLEDPGDGDLEGLEDLGDLGAVEDAEDAAKDAIAIAADLADLLSAVDAEGSSVEFADLNAPITTDSSDWLFDDHSELDTQTDWLDASLPKEHEDFLSSEVVTEETNDSEFALEFEPLSSPSNSSDADSLTDLDLDFIDRLSTDPLSVEIDEHSGPEVGAAELDSLANLFESDVPNLSSTWPNEEVTHLFGEESSEAPLEGAGDFHDLLHQEHSDDLNDNQDDLNGDLTLNEVEEEDLSGLLNAVALQANHQSLPPTPPPPIPEPRLVAEEIVAALPFDFELPEPSSDDIAMFFFEPASSAEAISNDREIDPEENEYESDDSLSHDPFSEELESFLVDESESVETITHVTAAETEAVSADLELLFAAEDNFELEMEELFGEEHASLEKNGSIDAVHNAVHNPEEISESTHLFDETECDEKELNLELDLNFDVANDLENAVLTPIDEASVIEDDIEEVVNLDISSEEFAQNGLGHAQADFEAVLASEANFEDLLAESDSGTVDVNQFNFDDLLLDESAIEDDGIEGNGIEGNGVEGNGVEDDGIEDDGEADAEPIAANWMHSLLNDAELDYADAIAPAAPTTAFVDAEVAGMEADFATPVNVASVESVNELNIEFDIDELEGDALTSTFAEPKSIEDMDSSEAFAAFSDLEFVLEPLPLPDADATSLNSVVEADVFSDLETMLETEPEPTIANPALAAPDFADLEALLAGESTVSPPALTLHPSTAANDSASLADSDDEFDDLEALLQEADQKLGVGSSPARNPANTMTRRSTRRNVIADQTMRVSVKHLDNLNNLVGEMVVNRNGLEQTQERLRQFLDNLLYQVQQLSDVGQRMRDLYERSLLESSLLSNRRSYSLSQNSGFSSAQSNHATGASFDALEMDRFTGFHTLSQEMIELIVRVRESASDIDFVVEESDQITRNFRQITTQLQEGLTRSRMVPFAQTADRLPRGVRDNAIKYGKQAELTIEGRDTLIDKMIVEQLYDPMTHLVNNAIAHGIETPEERMAAGKPPVGRIIIRTFHQGNQTVISVSDDGAGINTDAVKTKAVAKGLISAAAAQQMSRLEAYDLLFHHGFSTADKVDDLRGRGVGLDVVRNNLSEIRGGISIDSAVGKGTTFTIRLPLTLSISKALCCISNRARIAFPMDGVEDMLDVPKDGIYKDEQGRPCIQWRDSLLPFQPLSDLLKYNRVLGRGSVYGGNQEEDILSIVVLRSSGNYLALQVDQVLGEQEIVIKQLEGPVPKPIGVAGATVLGDGRIMPIADVLELIDLSEGRIRRETSNVLWETGNNHGAQDAAALKTDPTVLIVDDSITVRELLSMTFNKVGYRVEQARDGQEAWEKLRSGLPCDLVFCDIEMPRMDGLELLSRLQKDPNLSDIPIAMLTSRGADRHRQMAIQLGAKGYFTKPYLEEVLLDAAQRMLKGEILVAN